MALGLLRSSSVEVPVEADGWEPAKLEEAGTGAKCNATQQALQPSRQACGWDFRVSKEAQS